MVWRETCAMEERMRFVDAVVENTETFAAICQRFGVSRKTGYKWLGRYRSEGASGLVERSHAPLRHGQAHDLAVVQAVLELRERWRRWGPKTGRCGASCAATSAG